MLFSVLPRADVFISIGPLECAFAILLPIFEVPFIPPSIGPHFQASPLHIAQTEFPLVQLVQVSKVILAVALKLAIDEVAFIVAAVFPLKLAFAILLPLVKLTHVPGCTIIPRLFSIAMLHIFKPFSLIPSIISVDENS